MLVGFYCLGFNESSFKFFFYFICNSSCTSSVDNTKWPFHIQLRLNHFKNSEATLFRTTHATAPDSCNSHSRTERSLLRSRADEEDDDDEEEDGCEDNSCEIEK